MQSISSGANTQPVHQLFSVFSNRALNRYFLSLLFVLLTTGIGLLVRSSLNITIIAMLYSENIYFKIAFAVTYISIVWICLEAVRIPELRDLIKQGYETTMRITTMAGIPMPNLTNIRTTTHKRRSGTAMVGEPGTRIVLIW